MAPRAKGQPRRRKAVAKTTSNTTRKTEPAQPEWIPITEFTRFKDLPNEIRTMIWKFTLPRAAVQELRWRFWHHNLRHSYLREDFHEREGPDVIARCPAPMQTCQEARKIGLKIFTPMMVREDFKLAVGELIDPRDAWKLNIRGLVNDRIPEDHPDLVPYPYVSLQPQIPTVLPISVPKLNYFDLKNDFCYANWQTYSPFFDRALERTFVFPHRDFAQTITQEDSDNIRHLAIDYRMITGGNENWYRTKPGYNALEYQLNGLTDQGKFSNLETLTIVVSLVISHLFLGHAANQHHRSPTTAH